MSDLKHFTVDQLEQEIKRRKGIESKPEMINDPDFTQLKTEAQDIIDKILDGNYHSDNDDAHYMYETVMTTLFGNDFFDWFNENTN